MTTAILVRGLTALVLTAVFSLAAQAAPRAIDPASPANGITDLFSATFDGALSPCTGGDPAWCSFFGGKPGATRAIVVTPSPAGVINGVPLGFATVPAAGSYLDLSLNGSNTEVTIAGGTIAFPTLTLTISGSTVVSAGGAGVVFSMAPQTATLNASRQAEFLVNLAPALAVDFSDFGTIVGAPNGSCSGPLCALIPVLTLDMIRYRLLLQFDENFNAFTGDFIGQTGNNSILSITLNSTVPRIGVTDSVAPEGDLQMPYGDVTELATSIETVTVTNTGTADLLLGAVAGANPLAAPFALVNDNCTAQTLAPAASCTFGVRFTPGSVGSFSDSLDIPSNDTTTPAVTVSVSGNGVAALVPNINVTDSVAPASDRSVPFGSIAVGGQANQTVTVANTGNADLVLGQLGAANPLAVPFSVVNDNCSGQTVAPAGNCSFGLRFEPLIAGAVGDSLDIPSNDPDEPSVTVNLSGTGTALAAPNIVITDDALPANDRLVAFGNVTEATTRDRTVTVTNSGGAALVLGTVAQANPLAAPFSIVSTTCSGQTLAPSGTCTVVLRYAPASVGAANDSFDIPSSDPDEPSVTVSASGTGIAAGEGGVETPTPGGADSGFMAVDPATLAGLGLLAVWGLRRRRARRPAGA